MKTERKVSMHGAFGASKGSNKGNPHSLPSFWSPLKRRGDVEKYMRTFKSKMTTVIAPHNNDVG